MKLTKKILSVILAVMMVVTMLPTFAFAAGSDSSAAELKTVITAYEDLMNETGTVRTNLSAAYTAYKNACKAYDAYAYGYSNVDIATAKNNLQTAMNNMKVYKFDGYTSVNPSFTGDSTSYTEVEGTHYANLLYSPAVSSAAATWSNSGNVDYEIYYPTTVMMYDGKTNPKMQIVARAKMTANKTRNVFSLYPTKSNASAGNTTADHDVDDNFQFNEVWHGHGGNSDRTVNWTWDYFETSTDYGKIGVTKGDQANYLGIARNCSTYYWNSAANILEYKGTPTGAMQKYTLKWFSVAGEQYSDRWLTDVSTPIYVLNYKAIKEAVEGVANAMGGFDHSIVAFKNGGLENVFANLDKLTIDYKSLSYGSNAESVMNNLNAALEGLNEAPVPTDISNYDVLRNAMDSTATKTTNGVSYTVRTLGDAVMANDSYTACFTGFAQFKTAFKAAATLMADVNANGYSQNANAATVAAALTSAFDALEENHDFDYANPVTVPATCSATGTNTVTCKNCSKTDVETLLIQADAHNYGDFAPAYESGDYDETATYEHTKVCANNAAHTVTEACSFDFTAWEDFDDNGVTRQHIICDVCGGEIKKDKAESTYQIQFFMKDSTQDDSAYTVVESYEVDKNETPELSAKHTPAYDSNYHYTYEFVSAPVPATENADYYVIRTANAHSYTTKNIDPTCTEAGKITSTCACGYSKTEDDADAPAKGHTYSYTSLNNGNHRRTCTVCTATDVVACAYAEATTVKPNCTEGGYDKHVCKDCSYELRDNFKSANGHTKGTPFETSRILPTCTEYGSYVMTTNCSVCGAFIENNTYNINPTGHNVQTVVKNATCTEDAYFTIKCNNNGHIATGTDNNVYSFDGFEYSYYDANASYPSINRTGVSTYESTITVEIPGMEVDHLDITFDYSIKNGNTGHAKIFVGSEAVFDKTNTTGDNEKLTINSNKFIAQIYNPGNSNAGKIDVKSIIVYVKAPEGTVLKATDHSFTQYVTVEESTCAKAGKETATCDNGCGETKTRDKALSEKHNWVKGTVVPPTTTAQGYTNYTCSICTATKKDDYTNKLADFTELDKAFSALKDAIMRTDVHYSVDSLNALNEVLADADFVYLTAEQRESVDENSQTDVDAETLAIKNAVDALETITVDASAFEGARADIKNKANDPDAWTGASDAYAYINEIESGLYQNVNVLDQTLAGVTKSQADIDGMTTAALEMVQPQTYTVYVNDAEDQTVVFGTKVTVKLDEVCDVFYAYESNTTSNTEKYFCTDSQVTFVVKGNTYLRTVAAKNESEQHKVTYISGVNSKIIAIEYVEDGKDAVEIPDAPSYPYYDFVEYQVDGAAFDAQNITEDITVVAVYNQLASTITVKSLDIDTKTVVTNTYKYNDLVTLTNAYAKYWAKFDTEDDLLAWSNKETVDYSVVYAGDTYSFYAHENAFIAPITETDVNEGLVENDAVAKPSVITATEYVDSETKISFVSSYYDADKEVIEAGILVATKAGLDLTDISKTTVDGSQVYRLKSSQHTTGNQFVISILKNGMPNNQDFTIVAYLIYKDADGNQVVVYGNNEQTTYVQQ